MEKNKSEEELIDKTNTAISELVVDKDSMQKAFNYYNGVLDAEQYRYIKDNYGIGNPTSVEFVPLIRKHVDALVGEFLGTPILPKISCKDSKTISSITREKELMISSSSCPPQNGLTSSNRSKEKPVPVPKSSVEPPLLAQITASERTTETSASGLE